ncbi:MAG TPA: LLM class flavin-dependent oxidoreductase [Candidatus Dormibacteraeota bacterium]|nr:LLM class flavin-dependent oxidoreductase [Candidatus Dormibacteraeota bacterium]
MRFGTAFWASTGSWPGLRDAAMLADASGFDSIWLDDHLLDDEGDPDSDKLEAWVALSALAPITSRASLGHLVSANTFRNPGLVAKMAVTLDHASGGRAILGVGAGWFEREHEAFAIDFGRSAGDRLDRLGEALPILRGLLDGERVTTGGPMYPMREALVRPRPVQGHLPILVGGSGPRKTLPLVARWADVWNAYGTPAEIAEAAAILDARCMDIGRDPATIERSVNVNVVIRDTKTAAEAAWAEVIRLHQPHSREASLNAAGPPAEVAAALRPYADVGVRLIVLVLRCPWDLETIARLGEVRSALSG